MTDLKQLICMLNDKEKTNQPILITKLHEYLKKHRNVDPDLVAWIIKQAISCHISQYVLGYMYRYGYGIEIDHKKAVMLYQKSANQGNAFAQNGLGNMYQYGRGVEMD